MTEQQNQPLGGYFRQILDERGMSANMLATASGVAESTIRSLLKQGKDDSVSGPHPLVLRAVCDTLELDHLRIFQMAGYIPEDYYPTHLSPTAEYVATIFDMLAPEQQIMITSMLGSLSQAGSTTLNSSKIEEIIKSTNELRRKHAMFRARKLTLIDEAGRVAGSLLRSDPTEWHINSTFERLSALFEGDTDVRITRNHIVEVARHQHARIILNILLPRKEISDPIEKLYWLSRSPGALRSRLPTMTEEEQVAVRDLWLLLEEFAQ